MSPRGQCGPMGAVLCFAGVLLYQPWVYYIRDDKFTQSKGRDGSVGTLGCAVVTQNVVGEWLKKKEVSMSGRMKKGEYVVRSRAIGVGG